MNEVLALIFILIGAFFMLIGSVGLVRLPDLYTRMSATAKTSTIGVSFFMLATAVFFDDMGVTGRSVAIIIFIFLTTPVSSHLLARAAYLDGVRLWERSIRDDLKGKYHMQTRELEGREGTIVTEDIPAAKSPPDEEIPDPE